MNTAISAEGKGGTGLKSARCRANGAEQLKNRDVDGWVVI